MSEGVSWTNRPEGRKRGPRPKLPVFTPCPVCGTPFQKTRQRPLACSRACWIASVRAESASTLVERFWAKVNKIDGGCWLWTGNLVRGYGQICVGRTADGKQQNVYAHRFSWEHFNGPIPDGLDCLHKCDTPPCVNPDHLFLGTDLENQRDASAKGRLHMPRSKKLTLTERLEIFHAPRDRKTSRGLQDRYGISKSAVAQIRAGRFVGSPVNPSFTQRATHGEGESPSVVG